MEDQQFKALMSAIGGLTAAQQETASTVKDVAARVKRLEDEQERQEQLARDREVLRTQEQLGKRQERQVYEQEARGWIAPLEQKALVEAVENLDITDPDAREHFGLVTGGGGLII